ncbi:hypothetical protein [Schinkia azotoformans]|uniref:hypothetical protein n=1 Tax=Schinkia azotoformans TaxID=1454 RepID=UPI002DBCDF3C|nr:hypothetical protein [Schinkia azotoformans]MEC1768278.1 hypothetical protein [Schinkia azotoformans]
MLTGNNIDVKTLSANEILLNGVSLSGTNGSGLNIDENGNVEIAGNITMIGGTISWDSINKPSISYSELSGIKPPSDADNTDSVIVSNNNFTKIGADYVYTGTINANQINTEGLTAEKLYNPANNNHYAVVGGDAYGMDLTLYNGGTKVFEAIDNITGVKLATHGTPFLGAAFNTYFRDNMLVSPKGTWDFSSADVEGINVTAVFG